VAIVIKQEPGNEPRFTLRVACDTTKKARQVLKRLEAEYPGNAVQYIDPPNYVCVSVVANSLAEAIAEVEHKIDTM
jgi:hypothetical protein